VQDASGAARGWQRHFLALLLATVPLAAPGQEPGAFTERIVAGALAQVGVTVQYDGSYRSLAYPGGDVSIERGVYTDVIVRAYRAANIDLQVLVHEDMRRAFDAYPHLWGLSRPDSNIDHRRVPNLATFFRRHGLSFEPVADPVRFAPGDIVTWRLPSGVPHIGLVSKQRDSANDRRLVVHNIGAGTVAEDVLLAWPVTGHFRYAPSLR
jgi:uncharacterized protein